MHIHRGDAAVSVGRVVIDAALGAAAGGIKRDLIFPRRQLTAAAALLHAAENVEKLADALRLRRAGDGVRSRERGTDKARAGREIAGQTESAHAAAVGAQRQVRREPVFRRTRREGLIIVQSEKLLRERRLVRENAGGVIVHAQPLRRRLDRHAAGLIREQPVQPRRRKRRGKRRAGEIRPGKQRPRRREIGALRQHPRDKFKLRNVVCIAARRGVFGALGKVQTCHAQSLFVHRVVVERVAVRDVRHAEERIMRFERRAAAKSEREAPGRHDDLVAVGKLIVKCPAKIESVGFICRGCAHDAIPRFLSYCLPLHKGVLDKRRRDSPSNL